MILVELNLLLKLWLNLLLIANLLKPAGMILSTQLYKAKKQ